MDAAASAVSDSWIHRVLRGDAAPRSLPARLALAVLLFAVALLLRVLLLPAGTYYVFSAFFPAALVSALVLGAVPGLVTLALGALVGTFYPHHAGPLLLTPGIMIPFVSYTISGLLTCAVTQVMRTALDSLRASEQKFRALFAQSEISLYRMDMNGRYLEFNDAFLQICGYTSEEMGRLDYTILTPPEYAAEDARQNETIARTGHFGPYEKEYLRKDGSRVPVRLQGSVVTAPDGERYLWTVMEDITESRRVLASNAQLLSEHRAVSESRVVGLVRVKNRMVVWANAAFAEMFGYTPEELAGQPSRLFYADDDDYLAFAAAAQPVMREGGVFRTELKQVRRDGTFGWFEVSCSRAGVDSDEIVGAFVDMTQRRQALAAVRRSEARLSSIFTAMAEGLVVHARDGAIIDANPAAEHLLGLTREQLLGKTSYDEGWHALRDDGSPFPGEEHPAMVALRTGTAVRNEIMGVQTPGKRLRWLSINAQPVTAPELAASGTVIVTFADITARRELTDELARARTNLQAILDNVPARIALWKQDLSARFINRGAAEQFGMTPAAAVGRSMEEVVGAQRYRSSQPFLRAALAGKAQSQDRVEAMADGTTQVMRVDFIPEIHDGDVVGLYVLATNITELTLSLGRIRDLAQRLETVREDERRSVALTLHEGVAQELFAARLAIRPLAESVGTHPDLAAACARLEQVIDKCIADTRQVANDLRPAGLSQSTLASALALHSEYFGELAGLDIEVTEAPGLPDIDETAKLFLFRAAQEALTNVARHARARHVTISLSADAEQFLLQVRDDGVGLEPSVLAKAGSLGLLGMRERAAALGGTLTVTAAEHRGTMLTVALPRHDL